MNTYEQDTTIPVYIILNYDGIYTLKFPINPETLKKDIPSESKKVEIEGIGEVSEPTTPKLAKITIDSFFWQGVNYMPSELYVMWLERWQKSKKPANLIVTRLNYSMQVTCENFTHWMNAGEEEDIYFTLEMQEYRPHGVKKIGKIDNKNLLQKMQEMKDIASDVAMVLVDIPKPTRLSINRKKYLNPYTTVKNDTLSSISKKITDSSDKWKELYDENKTELGDCFANENIIPENTKLKLPDSWIQNSSYNIERGQEL